MLSATTVGSSIRIRRSTPDRAWRGRRLREDRTSKRHGEKARRSLLRWGVGSVEAAVHVRAAGRGCKRAERAIKPGKDVPVVGVGLTHVARVMYLVHIRPRGDPRESRVELRRHADVGVLKQPAQYGPGAIHGECDESDSEHTREGR